MKDDRLTKLTHQHSHPKHHAHSACPSPPAEINKAFELLHGGQCLRCVLTFQ